jgi:hypothetical protein
MRTPDPGNNDQPLAGGGGTGQGLSRNRVLGRLMKPVSRRLGRQRSIALSEAQKTGTCSGDRSKAIVTANPWSGRF